VPKIVGWRSSSSVMRKLLPIFMLVACARTERTEPLPGDRLPNEPTQRGLTVHEWGTYTSLQGSDGRSMDGLHHAEHLLPEFVFARDPLQPDQKGVAFLPEPVNQKLETPVIYFYGEDRQDISVDVRFPEGIISEWYPNATSFEPPLDNMPRMAGGEMSWKVQLIDPNPRAFNPREVPSDSIWAPSRRVAAYGVRNTQGEDEHFIFYRGLGRFERPFRVTSTNDRLTAANGSRERIPSAFLLVVDEEGGALAELGAIEPGSERTIDLPRSLEVFRSYLPAAKQRVADALIGTGLFEDEALAMVDTWEESYFTSPGARVLYVAPRAWTDALLPIEIDPQPHSLVRTLVGRVEVLTAAEETEIVARVVEAAKGGTPLDIDAYGRFTEPKLRRAMELIDDPQAKGWCDSFVTSLSSLP
jgi:hypothetical protein